MSDENTTRSTSPELDAHATGRSLESILEQAAWEAGHIARQNAWVGTLIRRPVSSFFRVWETVFAPKK